MEKAKINIEEIKSHICLRKDRIWKNIEDTNCYAYALWLDYPESKFPYMAYQLGSFSAMQRLGNIPNDLGFYPYEGRLEKDLRTLKIKFTEIDPDVDNFCVINEETGTIDYCWSIALFDGPMDFHFLRKDFDGRWSHKRGYFEEPRDYDSDDRKILDPRKCNLEDYEYIKTYQLTLTRKTNSLTLKKEGL